MDVLSLGIYVFLIGRKFVNPSYRDSIQNAEMKSLAETVSSAITEVGFHLNTFENNSDTVIIV